MVFRSYSGTYPHPPLYNHTDAPPPALPNTKFVASSASIMASPSNVKPHHQPLHNFSLQDLKWSMKNNASSNHRFRKPPPGDSSRLKSPLRDAGTGRFQSPRAKSVDVGKGGSSGSSCDRKNVKFGPVGGGKGGSSGSSCHRKNVKFGPVDGGNSGSSCDRRNVKFGPVDGPKGGSSTSSYDRKNVKFGPVDGGKGGSPGSSSDRKNVKFGSVDGGKGGSSGSSPDRKRVRFGPVDGGKGGNSVSLSDRKKVKFGPVDGGNSGSFSDRKKVKFEPVDGGNSGSFSDRKNVKFGSVNGREGGNSGSPSDRRNGKKSNPAAAVNSDKKSKIFIRIKSGGDTKSGGNKVPAAEAPAVAEDHSSLPDDGEEVLAKTWNLRPRKKVTKGQNGNGGAPKIGGATVQEIKPQTPCRAELTRSRNGIDAKVAEKKDKGKEKKEEKLEFSIPLAREEIEEDFFTMTGSRPARRPKKRPRNIQKQLDNIFPGLWLASITPDLYKVPEPRTKGKRNF